MIIGQVARGCLALILTSTQLVNMLRDVGTVPNTECSSRPKFEMEA